MITNRPVRFSPNTNIRELRVSSAESENTQNDPQTSKMKKRKKAATEKDKQKVASETSMINRLHLKTGLQNFSFFL